MPMSYQNNQNVAAIQSGALVSYMNKVYRWMAIGLLLTALVAYYVATTPSLVQMIFSHTWVFWGLVILQLGVVLFFSYALNRLNYASALLIYLAYSVLTGLTLSVIFLAYTQASINSAFLVTAVAFAGLSMFGYVTKKDLGPIGTFCTMALFGFIGVLILGMFFPKMLGGTMQIIISVAGILIFSGLTAYDTQKIKNQLLITNDEAVANKLAIFGALTLYLDFINLFLNILRLMGNRK